MIEKRIYCDCISNTNLCGKIGKVFHKEWIKWFNLNKENPHKYHPIPNLPKFIDCPKCNGVGYFSDKEEKSDCLLNNNSEIPSKKSYIIDDANTKNIKKTLTVNTENCVENITPDSSDNVGEVKVKKKKKPETNIHTNNDNSSSKEIKSEQNKKEYKNYESSGWGGIYGNYFPPIRTFWIKGRSYRVEKENKNYYVFDENNRILQVFDGFPSEEQIKEIDEEVCNYQKNFTKEQKLKTIQSLLVALDRVKPLIRDGLLELEYSGINDREVFIDMRALVRSHKTTMNTLRKMCKVLNPEKEEDVRKKEKKKQ